VVVVIVRRAEYGWPLTAMTDREPFCASAAHIVLN
jgi:hypothetical protein